MKIAASWEPTGARPINRNGRFFKVHAECIKGEETKRTASVGSTRSELHQKNIQNQTNMKFFVIASLVAAAMAEADPGYLYGGYGLGYAGLGYGYGGFGYGKSAPCVNAANVPVPCAAGHYLGKREADAEADPGLLGLGYGLGYAGLGYGYAGFGYGYGKSAPCVNAANVPVPCAAGHYLGKREAEAEAEADPAFLGLGYGLGYAGLGYGYAGLGYGKNAPCVNAFNVPVPCAGKRKREAEAEPGFLGLGYGLGYAGLGYGYGVGVVAGHQNGLPHGVTTTGVHSSLVGVCTNVLGVQVPC